MPQRVAPLALAHPTSDDSCSLVAAAGIETVRSGMSRPAIDETVRRVRAGLAGRRPEEKAAYVFPRLFAEAATPTMLADLLPAARGWRPQLLVHENAELASPLVGAILGIPSVTHAFGGAIPAPILGEATDRLGPLWAEHGLRIPALAGCFSTAYLDICPPAVQSVPVDHIPVSLPLRPVSYTGETPDTLPEFLALQGDPLVYLTLGTVQGQARDQVAVLRSVIDSLSGSGVRLLVTVGPAGDPDALGPQPAHVTVERFVSQTVVLPVATAVVSHAGSGTVLGALASGLPQLCLPQAADQFRNAAGVTTAGAGLALHPDDATPDAIGAAVHRILVDDDIRRAARGIARDITAMPSPYDVVGELVALVHDS